MRKKIISPKPLFFAALTQAADETVGDKEGDNTDEATGDNDDWINVV